MITALISPWFFALQVPEATAAMKAGPIGPARVIEDEPALVGDTGPQ